MSISGLADNIGRLLETSAAKYGGKSAIRFDEGGFAFTYGALNKRVNQFANVLQTHGIKAGQHVAVMLPNIPEFPVTWLALAKLGAVMVPINVRYQVADLEYVLNDSDAVGLVIHTEFADTFKEASPKLPNIDHIFRVGPGSEDVGSDINLLADRAFEVFPAADLGLDDMVNIQYTSGTTGFPKGCILTHEYWLTIGKLVADFMVPCDVFLSVTPFYYMDPQWEMLACLTIVATMVLAESYSPSGYMDLVRKHKATVSWATMAPWILKQPPSDLDQQHKLRFVLVGGFPPNLHHEFENRFNVVAREAYGMTEIGPGMFVEPDDNAMTGSGSVGKAFEVRPVRIVDAQGKDVAAGEIGELWISGPGMFKGYYHKPEATAEAFDGKWFKTGDLFREDENGYYYIVGRIKDMIRRSGDNVSASEVEGVLDTHPKILSAAVVPVKDIDRGEEVKAYLVLKPGESPETVPPEEVIAFCQERIASFKIPRYIEYKEEFSLTPSGKIQKHLLLKEKEDLTEGCYDRLK